MKSVSTKGGATKLEQLYKLLWNELEYFIRIHSTTPEHEIVLEYSVERNKNKRTDPDRGNKRISNKASASLHKKPKLCFQLFPEISDSDASLKQGAMFYETGLSSWHTWTHVSTLSSKRKQAPLCWPVVT